MFGPYDPGEWEAWIWLLEHGATGVVLKPPYVEEDTERIYYRVECCWPVHLELGPDEAIIGTVISGEGYTVLDALEDMICVTAIWADMQ